MGILQAYSGGTGRDGKGRWGGEGRKREGEKGSARNPR